MKNISLSLLLSVVVISSVFATVTPARRGVPTDANTNVVTPVTAVAKPSDLTTEGPLLTYTPSEQVVAVEPTPEQIKQQAEERQKWEAEWQKRMDEQYAQGAAKLGTSVEMLKKAENEFKTIGENLSKAIPSDKGNEFERAMSKMGNIFTFVIDPKSMATDFAEWKKSMATVANLFNDNQATLISSLNSVVTSPTIQTIARNILKKYGVDDQQANFMIAGILTLPGELPGMIAKFKTFADYVNMNIKHV